ncbi:MAG: hypothetical protein IPI85_17805 [Dehalococcoidia bacterium]|nr:hypothetical protein [Dehalococcoidia bacterium]
MRSGTPSLPYNDVGTMGEKMNDAGSGNPWTEVIEGSYTAAELLRIITAALAGELVARLPPRLRLRGRRHDRPHYRHGGRRWEPQFAHLDGA